MLSLHRQRQAAQDAHGRDLLDRQLAYTDRQIDALVYRLYGLSQEEIAIVEGAAGE